MVKAIVTFFILTITIAQAQETIPGLIPRFYSIEAAVDLPIPPEEAHAKALQGLDLSLLEPDATTNIWKPDSKKIPHINLLSSFETVRFIKELPSRTGQFRFTVATKDNREFIVILSKKIHNVLLRRNILAKLGYETQPMSWVSQLNVDFENTIDRDLFKEEMKDKLLAGTQRWIRSEEDLVFNIQDALILTPESEIYNLATGLMPEGTHQGRRLLRAPYVPLALVDTTESANLFSWEAGRMVLDHVKLNHTQDLDTSYNTSWEDARWIARRMGHLNRKDFEEIVALSFFPRSVEKLLIEKFISRRNHLIKLLKLETEFSEITFDPYVEDGTDLVNGEIVKEFFDGYASRFSYGDPETPFNSSEVIFYTISRAQSTVINLAMQGLNKLIGTQDSSNYSKVIEGIVKDQGPFFPVQGVVIPTFHGSMTLSRDIVTGSYLGTNNRVQLVDNFGFAVDAGLFGGIEGLPIPIGFHAGAGVTFQRVYSHVKPVLSLKKSFKEPYRNMIVPFLIKNMAHKIDELSTSKGEDQTVAINAVVGELKSALAVGESFIVTDSLVPRILGDVETSITEWFFLEKNMLRIHARAQAQRLMVSRFHFHRADENTFHIYQDYGKNLKLMLTVKLKSYVPLLTFNARWGKATAETHFYAISLHPRSVSADLLKALRNSLLSLNHEALKDQVHPHKVEHDVREGGHFLQFLMFKRNKIVSGQNMILTHADGGEKKYIYRRYDASTTSFDLNGYLIEAFNNIISILLNTDVSLSEVHSLNPGFKVKGSAKNKIMTSEFDGKRITTQYQRIMNGWEAKTKKLNSLLNEINRETGRKIFQPVMTVNTNAVRLYQISYTYTLTQEGTYNLLNAPWVQIRDVLGRYRKIDNILANYFKKRFDRITYNLNVNNEEWALKYYHATLKQFQEEVTIRGLEEIVGSENIAYQGKIEGFRQGDEGGDSPIFTDVHGALPLPLQISPTRQVIQNWGIIEGELLLNWMMERAI